MKTILKTILPMAMLCLAGCSGEDPQSVAFNTRNLSTGAFGDVLAVDIIANCPWTIQENSTQILIEDKAGEGNMPIRVNVAQNLTHDDLVHKIILTSSDGTSSDTLTVNQAAMPGIFVGHVDEISEEGGDFSVSVSTNVDRLEVETPDWISFTGSRALTGYAYSFNAGQNLTGKKRSGDIVMRGEDLSKSIHVIQKAYAPTGIEVEGLGKALLASDTPQTFPYKLVPEYACQDYITVSASLGEAYLKDGMLYIRSSEQGSCTLDILNGSDALFSKTFEFVTPELPLTVKSGKEYCVGTSFKMMAGFPEEYASIEVSDESVLVKEGNTYVLRKEGSADVTVRNILSGKEAKSSVTASFITFPSISVSSIVVGSYSIVSYGVEANMYDVSEYTIYTTYGDSAERLEEVSGKGAAAKGITSVGYTLPTFQNAQNGKIHVHVEAVISGEKKTRTLDL